MIDLLGIILVYAFLGGSIKLIDQSFDEGVYSQRLAIVLAAVSGVVMGAIMVADTPFSTAFYAAMLISLLIARKIDNLAFLTGSLCAIVTFLGFAAIYSVSVMVLPILSFLVAGFADELGDQYAHDHQLREVLRAVLHYRPFSDLALLSLIILGTFSWTYIAPYFAFTFAYIAVKGYTTEDSKLHSGISLGVSKIGALVRVLRSMRL